MNDIAPFRGFPAETVRFLADIAEHNEKPWFDANRDRYEQFWLAPARSFVVAMGEALRTLDPDVRAEPKVNGSIFRINRDVRFSADKRPYKDHLDLGFPVGDSKGWDRSSFFFRITPTELMFGVGQHVLADARLAAFRAALDDEKRGRALEAAIAEVRGAGFTVGRQTLKRVPKGFPPDHPRADLLRYTSLHAGFEGPHPKELGRADLVGFAHARWEKMLPIHRWLLTL